MFVVNICGLSALAQPPPPPPPLIYKAPEKSDLKEFVSEDKTFQITFPGVPQKTRQEIENGTVTSYQVYRQGSNSIVNAVDFSIDLEINKEKIYGIIKNNLLKIPKSTIEAERMIVIDGKAGKEFDVLQDYHYSKVRIFIIGKRIYEIRSDVTNWHILSKYNTDKITEFKKETERFFESFKLNKSPENSAASIPSDFLGAATETSYKNTFFNFSLSFSKEWSRLTDMEIDASKNVGLEVLKTDKEKINEAFEDAVKKETIIFLLTEKNNNLGKNANLGIGVLKQPSYQINSEMAAVATKNFFLTNPKFTLLKDVQKTKLGGIEFSTFTIKSSVKEEIINQKLFTAIRKGYSLTFVLTYFNSDGQNKLEKIMESLRFDTK